MLKKLIIIFLLLLFIPTTSAQSRSTKVITVVNYEIVAAETWEQALNIATEFENEATAKAVQKFFIRMRENDNIDDLSFDYNFISTSPSTYLTNTGAGVAFNGVSLPNIFVRTRSADAVLEIIYFH